MAKKRASTREDEDYARQLGRTLAHAFYWIDDALQNHFQSEANFSVPRAQSMIMICIGDGITRQSDIARHLRVSKQAVRQGIKELEAKGLVKLEPDLDNGRQKVVSFTRTGKEMRNVAVEGQMAIENILKERIGPDNLDTLSRILYLDWGKVPTAADINANRSQ